MKISQLLSHSADRVVLLLLLLIVAACGASDKFSISIEMGEDIERQIVVTYATPTGIAREYVGMRGGKAKFEGEVATWSVAMLTWSDGEPIGQCIVRDGEHITLIFNPGESLPTVKGSGPTKLLYNFISDNDSAINAGDRQQLTTKVVDFVGDHPSDPASLVVINDYLDARGNEALSDSLLELILPEARPATLLLNYGTINAIALNESKLQVLYPFSAFVAEGDSLLRILPTASRVSLFAILSSSKSTRAKQVEALRAFSKEADSLRLTITEISAQPDSVEWRRSIASDSATWRQVWAPGATASSALKRLSVPREPFYVVTDSTGSQIYRGSDYSDMLRAVRTARRLTTLAKNH